MQNIVRIASKYDIPLVPFSGLTSLEGHVHPPDLNSHRAEGRAFLQTDQLPRGRAWCLSFAENMNKIVELHKDDLDVVVQPGIPYEALNTELAKDGLLFPVDPGPGVGPYQLTTHASF